MRRQRRGDAGRIEPRGGIVGGKGLVADAELRSGRHDGSVRIRCGFLADAGVDDAEPMCMIPYRRQPVVGRGVGRPRAGKGKAAWTRKGA